MKVRPSMTQISSSSICLTITKTIIEQHYVPIPAQIAGEGAVRHALEEEEAAHLLEIALANTETDSDEDWDGLGYALASQEALAESWLTPEEDAAWQYLQEGM